MKLGYLSLPGSGVIDPLLAAVVAQLQAEGVALAGTVQVNGARADRAACDMDLKVLPDGPLVRISTDRGPLARGCRLDAGALEQAVPRVLAALPAAEMLVVNKFGKQEGMGKGLSGAIAEALEAGLPVLLGVNGLNLPAFHAFEAGLAERLPPEVAPVLTWCRHALAERRQAQHLTPAAG